MERSRGLDGGALKLMAAALMLIDHVGAILLPERVILRCIGRLAFPIFAFFIAEGYAHTRSFGKYLLRMAIFAAVSEIPFNLEFGRFFVPGRQNVLLTFCTPSGKYNVTYDITDTEGNRHNGTVYGLNIAVTQENGSSYTVHNQCTDADGTGLTTAKNIDGLFVCGTNIVVELDTPTDIAVYTILGQKIGAACHATTYQLNVSSGLYIVQMGNKATKIVVR